eukprot:3282330-Prymnesium_polylepis.1
MQLSAVLALCSPPGESVSTMRGAAESMSMSCDLGAGGGGSVRACHLQTRVCLMGPDQDPRDVKR